MFGMSTVCHYKNARGNGFGATISYECIVANTSPLCLENALCSITKTSSCCGGYGRVVSPCCGCGRVVSGTSALCRHVSGTSSVRNVIARVEPCTVC